MNSVSTDIFYQHLFESLDDAIAVQDAEGRIIMANQKFCQLTGYTKNEWIGKNGISSILINGWINEFETIHANHLPSNQRQFEAFLQRKNKTGFLASVRYSPLIIPTENIEGTIISIRDISESKKQLAQLKENDERLHFLMEASSEGIAIHEKGIIIDVNDALLKMFNYQREDLIGKSIFEFAPKHEHEKIIETIKSNITTPLIREIFDKSGSIRFVELTGKNITFHGKEIRVILIRDVSELREKQIEERRLISLIEVSPYFIAMMDTKGFHYLNPAGRTMLGYGTDEDISKLKVEDIVAKRSYEAFLNEAIPHSIEHGIWRGNTILRTKTNQEIECSKIVLAQLDESGKIDFIASIAEDITEQSKARQVLMESRERLKYFMQESREAILIHEDGIIIDFNNEALRMFDYQPEELFKRQIDTLYDTSFRQEMKSRVKKKESFLEELTAVKSDGTRFDIEVSSRRRQYKGKDVRVVGILDISQRKKVERALRSSEVQLNAAVEGTNVGIWDWNLVTNRISFNDAWKNIYGYKNDALPKYFDEWRKLVHPDDLPQLLSNLRKHLYRQTSMFHHIYRSKNISGNYIVIEAKGKLIRDENNLPVRIIGTAVDITERQQMEDALRKSQAQLTALIENREESIWSVDSHKRILNFNTSIATAFKMLYNITLNQGDIITKDLPVELGTLWTERYERSMKGESYSVVDPFNIEGNNIFVEFSLNPIRMEKGDILGVSVVGRNITQQKYFEQSLQEAKEAAEAANKTKSQFLANMSHEIRTPMNGIIGFTDVLLQSHLDQEQREYLDIVRISADSLLQLINDLLDISKIESGKLELINQPFGPYELINEVIRSFKVKAEEQGLKLMLKYDESIPKILLGDDLRLQQVLINLISNAVKFSSKSEVIIEAILKETNQQYVVLAISVQDFGIGIEPDQQKLIFEPFRQVENLWTRKYGGTGLGLSIAKKLVNMMEGDIKVESEPGKGSRFYFTARFSMPLHK